MSDSPLFLEPKFTRQLLDALNLEALEDRVDYILRGMCNEEE